MPTPRAQATPRKTTPRSTRKPRTTASSGGLGSGLLALVAGLWLHSHYEPIKQVCNSSAGVVGQAFDPSAQSHCSLDSALAEGGTVLTVIGAIILAGTLLMALGLLGTYLQGRAHPEHVDRRTATPSNRTNAPSPRAQTVIPEPPPVLVVPSGPYQLTAGTEDPMTVTIRQPAPAERPPSDG